MHGVRPKSLNEAKDEFECHVIKPDCSKKNKTLNYTPSTRRNVMKILFRQNALCQQSDGNIADLNGTEQFKSIESSSTVPTVDATVVGDQDVETNEVLVVLDQENIETWNEDLGEAKKTSCHLCLFIMSFYFVLIFFSVFLVIICRMLDDR